jgi:hypothetical protein
MAMTTKDGERKRGVLSESDRRYLKEPDEFDRQGRYQRRNKIPERITNSMYDLRLLADELDDNLLAEVFAPEQTQVEDEDGDTYTRGETKEASTHLAATVSFLIRAARASRSKSYSPDVSTEASLFPFKETVERGVEKWLNIQAGLTADVSVSISVENPEPLDDFADELRRRDDRVTGKERIEAAARLGRAGYSDEEILEILGPAEPDDEDIPDEKVDMDDLVPDHAVIDEEDDETDEDE